MIIDIKGRIKNKKIVEQYIENLCIELKINRLWSKVVLVEFKTKLDEEAYGLCWGDYNDGYCHVEIARTCCGEDIPYEDIMLTLAHEFVHVKQYMRKQLSGYKHTWNGKKAYNYQYDNEPWEREAYGKQEELYEECWPL